MDEKKSIKVSLVTFLLVIVIIVMGIFMYKFYNEKTEANKKSVELQNQVNSLNGTVTDLKEKINNISETINSNNSNDVKYDVEISLSEIESIDVTNPEQIKQFYNKYYGKKVKVTGYVSAFGDEFDSSIGAELATGVNIGDSKSYESKVYAYGVTYDESIIQKIHNLKTGEKISLIGTVPNPNESWSIPVELYLKNIIKE